MHHVMLRKPIFNYDSMSSNLISEPIFVGYLFSFAFFVDWKNGTSLSGQLSIDVTADDAEDVNTTPSWIPLFQTNPITISGGSGSRYIAIRDTPARYCRVRYISSSGSGELKVSIAGH